MSTKLLFLHKHKINININKQNLITFFQIILLQLITPPARRASLICRVPVFRMLEVGVTFMGDTNRWHCHVGSYLNKSFNHLLAEYGWFHPRNSSELYTRLKGKLDRHA